MKRLVSVTELAVGAAILAGALWFLHETPVSPATSGDGSGYVIAAVRYLAIGVGWYLAATTVLSFVAHVARSARAIDFTERLTAGPVNRLIRGAVGAAFVAATLTPAAAGAQTQDPVPVMTWVEDEPGASVDTPQLAQQATPASAHGATTEVVVAPGQHLWSIATRQLAEQLGREPTDREVTPYWLEVIAANKSRLRDPAVPDLIYPGDRILLPLVGTFPK